MMKAELLNSTKGIGYGQWLLCMLYPAPYSFESCKLKNG